jgi:hypothetical protein
VPFTCVLACTLPFRPDILIFVCRVMCCVRGVVPCDMWGCYVCSPDSFQIRIALLEADDWVLN